ncbi:hypothetical protein Y1Q_0007975 [Alligator mississippiensis]|uniref:Uncharacterized protein n=1 Tax=Alligator mississippiensis TaxID=8496 RepID=A0A151NF16_ALLMI|nr:hypothetical protein Y1Q_0007975 [Alligator mississippiensis]
MEDIAQEKVFQRAMREHWGQMEAIEDHCIMLLEQQTESQDWAVVAADADCQALDTLTGLAGMPMSPGT